jgi:protein O-GlcNAc transferase
MKNVDLYLDTPHFNAQTSTGSVLWAGCPILTLMGNTVQGRMCASVVTSAGFANEMIVNTIEEYENRAVHLGTHVKELRKLRKDVEAARSNMKIFDTTGYVKDFEKGLREAWRQFVITKKFESFEISAL